MLIKIGIDPVLVTIGGLKIHWYGIMIAIGLYAGIQIALADSPRRGIDRDKLMNTALIAAVLGVLGGRLYYVVQNNPDYYLHHLDRVLAVWEGGMAFFGAIFGGAIALIVSAIIYKIPLWSLLDVGALGLTIGQTFGRVGNIINGDIVGYRTNGWGFEYTNPHTFAPRDVPVQPANLYELLIALAMFILLWSLRKRIRPEGMLAMVYLLIYTISQFLIFFVRDNVYVIDQTLKQAQVTAIVVFVLTLPFVIYLLRKDRARPAATPEPTAQETRAGEVVG